MIISRRRFCNSLVGVGLFGRGVHAFGVEPASMITAAAIGEGLLNGALSFAAGKLLSSIFVEASVKDVAGWIRAAVAELEMYVSAELKRQLDAKVLEEIRAELAGVDQNLKQYSQLSRRGARENRYLIESADVTTARVIARSLNYDQALFISTGAMGYRLIALQALHNLDSQSGHITHARESIDEFVKRISLSRDRMAAKISDSERIKTSCDNPFDACRVFQDGIEVQKIAVASTEARKKIVAYADEFIASHRKAAADLKNSANKSIQLTAQAYDTMSRKVGRTYKVPPV